MRTVAAFALLGSLALVLAGCLVTPDESPSDDDARTSPVPGEGDEPRAPEQEADPSTGSDDEPDAHGPGGDPEAGAGEGCLSEYPPVPPHPQEQQVDAREDLRCPGQYTVIEEGSGPSWDVPVWETGDWWLYEFRDNQDQCERMQETVTDDSEKLLETPVYTVELQRYRACSLSTNGDPAFQNRTHETLMHITDDGFIRHDLIFPLREGKRWAMAGNCEDDCVIMEVTQVTHEPEYDHQGDTVEVWYTEWGFDRGGSEVTFKKWWSVDHDALLREEMWMQNMDAPLIQKELVDHGSG